MSHDTAAGALDEARARRGVKFDGTINLGHILTMIVMAGSGASMYFSLDKRISRQEDLAPFVQSARDRTDASFQASLTSLAGDVKDTKQAVDKLTMKVELQNALATNKGQK